MTPLRLQRYEKSKKYKINHRKTVPLHLQRKVMDDKRYLLGLISEGEHQQQDFKYRVSDAVKLAKSVSAFANTEGGRLLIGVRDDGHLSGVRSEEEIYMMHQAAYRYCRPEASIKFDTYHVEGRTIVVTTVPPSDRRPICAIDETGKSCAYIRIADENIVASPVHLAIWKESQRQQLTRASRVPRHQVITLLARLIRFRVARWEHVEQQFLFSLVDE